MNNKLEHDIAREVWQYDGIGPCTYIYGNDGTPIARTYEDGTKQVEDIRGKLNGRAGHALDWGKDR